MSPDELAQLELEIRQLDGVVLVTFTLDDEATLVEVTVDDGVAADEVRTQTERLAESQLSGAVVVTVLDQVPLAHPSGPGLRLRVQLLAVVPLPGGQIEVHLAYRERRAVSVCRGGDRIAVAGAVLDGLGKLGLRVPFEATAVHLISSELGDGAMVQLRHQRQSGMRRGLAGGRREEEAIARAVLNGLNRYLEEGIVGEHAGSDALGSSHQVGGPGRAPGGQLGAARMDGGTSGAGRARAGWHSGPVGAPH